MSEFEIEFSRAPEDPSLFYADLSGAIDASTVQNFQAEMEKVRSQGAARLVMDVSHIKYVNSTGLGSLVKYADALKAIQGGLVLVKVPAKVKIVIEMLGLHEFFAMCETREEGVEALGGFGAGYAVTQKFTSPPPVVPQGQPISKSSQIYTAPTEIAPVKPSVSRHAQPGMPPVHFTSVNARSSPSPPPVHFTPVTQKTPVQFKPSAPVAPPKPLMRPVAAPVLPKRVAPAEVKFPKVVGCASCHVGVEVSSPGKYKCPRCLTILEVDNSGTPTFYAPERPMPIQITLPTTAECMEALKRFVGAIAEAMKMPLLMEEQVKEAVFQVVSTMIEKAYESNSAVYHVLIASDGMNLTIKMTDYGK
ncbi:MAG: STAS domain-containing protein, partial [Planctomycetota bacterium]